MRTTTIPDTDLHPSAICLGVADFGVRNTEPQAHALLDEFATLGGTFIDTARVYSDWVPGERSRSERILGDWLNASGMRDKMIVATKGAHPLLSSMNVARMSRAEIQSDLDGSLSSLRIDRIDLYYLHRDEPARPVEEIIDSLDEFVRSGKIRYYACSNWKPDRIEQAVGYAHKKGSRGFVANQMLWNVGCWTMRPVQDPTIATFDRTTQQLHRRLPLAAIPYSSQANGFFTKLHALGGVPDQKLSGSAYCTPRNLEAYRVMKEITDTTGVSITELVLLYLLEQDVPVIPIVGCHSIELLRASVSAVDKQLVRDHFRRLEKAVGAR